MAVVNDLADVRHGLLEYAPALPHPLRSHLSIVTLSLSKGAAPMLRRAQHDKDEVQHDKDESELRA
ncbi:MAG: hypothetical protein NVSMB31_09990 [Vulcanimicrobiaceae bacterium]